jgi:hypothetical protein
MHLVNLVWGLLITVAVTGIAIAAMLLVRRNAPEGGYFADGDRAAGVFGVLATGVLGAARLHRLLVVHQLRPIPDECRDGGAHGRATSRDGAVLSGSDAHRVDKASALADAQTQIDVATFTQWVDAYAQEQTELADFYYQRFRPEFKPAMDAWIATRPLRNPDAPLTPFAMPEYQVQARAKAEQLEAEAEDSSAQARENIQRATNYVLAVVLFAASLFFAGMSTKLGSPRLRRVLLGFGLVVFVGTVAWIATFPISISI